MTAPQIIFSLKIQHAFRRDTFQNFIIRVCKLEM